MRKEYLIAAVAGLVSGALLLSIALGGPGAFLLGYLAPLPLFLAGLSLGALAAGIAGLVGTVVAALAAGPGFAALYAASLAAPVAVLCRQGLLSRTNDSGDIEWYPLGWLLLWACGMAAAAFLLALVGFALLADGLLPAMERMIADVGKLFALQIEAGAAGEIAQYVPGIMAVSWLIQTIVNGALAQGLLQRFERNIRPRADIAELELPAMLLLGLGAALALALSDGTLGMIGKTLAAIALVPYFLLGLGFVHRRVRRMPGRYFALVLVYALALIWPLTLVVVAVGLLEHASQWRRRRGGRPGDGKET